MKSLGRLTLVALLVVTALQFAAPAVAGGGYPPIVLMLTGASESQPRRTSVQPGAEFELTVRLEMQKDSHYLSFLKFIVEFDPDVFEVVAMEATSAFKEVFEQAIDNTEGWAGMSLGIGASPVDVVRSSTDVAKMTLEAKTSTSSPKAIHWRLCDPIDSKCSAGSQARSTSDWDSFSENVLGAAFKHLVCVAVDVDSCSFAGPNLVRNASFEQDGNGDRSPDAWSNDRRFRRSGAAAYRGHYSGRFRAADDPQVTISQTVRSVSPGATYSFVGRVRIPSTSDTFAAAIQLRWRSAGNRSLRTDLIRRFRGSTDGEWHVAAAGLVAPAGATNVQVRFVITSLDATIFVDSLDLDRK